MLQYAFARRIELDGYNVKLDLREFENYDIHNGYELNKIFNIKMPAASPDEIKSIRKRKLHRNIRKRLGFNDIIIEQKDYSFLESYIPKKDNCYIKGHWNSEKFFLPYKNKIIDDFTFPFFTEEYNILLSKKIINNQSISIHVRRGDYVNNSLHGDICSLTYYANAIKHFIEKTSTPSFYIFSNDIRWCKEHLSKFLDEHTVTYVTGNSTKNGYRDMQLMSLCKHNIIANSTFSWWAAYLNLNPEKTIVSPNKWFNSKDNQGDIIPNNWIQLPII